MYLLVISKFGELLFEDLQFVHLFAGARQTYRRLDKNFGNPATVVVCAARNNLAREITCQRVNAGMLELFVTHIVVLVSTDQSIPNLSVNSQVTHDPRLRFISRPSHDLDK